MSSYRLRPSAEADLEEVWVYTVETWSVTQAEHYVSDIFASINHLVANPHLGRPVAGLHSDYRKYKAGHHLIFYIAEVDAIDVLRIVHEKRDIVRRLDE